MFKSNKNTGDIKRLVKKITDLKRNFTDRFKYLKAVIGELFSHSHSVTVRVTQWLTHSRTSHPQSPCHLVTLSHPVLTFYHFHCAVSSQLEPFGYSHQQLQGPSVWRTLTEWLEMYPIQRTQPPKKYFYSISIILISVTVAYFLSILKCAHVTVEINAQSRKPAVVINTCLQLKTTVHYLSVRHPASHTICAHANVHDDACVCWASECQNDVKCSPIEYMYLLVWSPGDQKAVYSTRFVFASMTSIWAHWVTKACCIGWPIVDGFDDSELKQFFDTNYTHIYHVFYDMFVYLESERKAKGWFDNSTDSQSHPTQMITQHHHS